MSRRPFGTLRSSFTARMSVNSLLAASGMSFFRSTAFLCLISELGMQLLSSRMSKWVRPDGWVRGRGQEMGRGDEGERKRGTGRGDGCREEVGG